MQVDKTTLKDLSFLGSGSESIFQLLDHTTTQEGKECLRKHIQQPPGKFEDLVALQQDVQFFAIHTNVWTNSISNGTMVMLSKFFESADHSVMPPGKFNLMLGNFLQKFFKSGEYSFSQFSISHLADFLRGCKELTTILEQDDLPERLKKTLTEMDDELDKLRLADAIINVNKQTAYRDVASLSYLARREMKNPVYRLMNLYARLDMLHSMGIATVNNNWIFPELKASFPISMKAKKLYHPLLKKPVSYDIEFNETKNFLLLTGANMSGKTTFMRTLGVSALLAHLGMGVPASSFSISFMEGIITNMHVEDNLITGESYFFAEVQRIKQTAEKLLQPLPHLVLMDELFKGTNVHDAYECTKAVVEGLLLHKRHMMVLSTHLYEVAQQFKDKEAINFSYFVTDMTEEGNYSFTYELKPGISNDRIGYRILKKEGVLDLLHIKTTN